MNTKGDKTMRFKKKDWTITRERLIKELENYYIDFQVSIFGGWTKSRIRNFLHMNFHLTRHRITPDHVKQIIQILKKEVEQPQPLNTKDTQYPQR